MKMKCIFCGKEIKGYGNSAAPAGNGICCDSCNGHIVVPYRVFLGSLEKGNAALLVRPFWLDIITPKGKYFTLEELQEAVDGYIEIAPEVQEGCLTVVNEEGLLRGYPHNQIAHQLFGIDIVGRMLIVPRGIFEAPEED